MALFITGNFLTGDILQKKKFYFEKYCLTRTIIFNIFCLMSGVIWFIGAHCTFSGTDDFP